MSKTIDERVVSMQFDNQKFEKNIEQTIASLNNLDDTINDFGSKGEDAFINLQEGLSRTEIAFIGFYEKIGGYLGDLAIKGAEFVKSMSFDQVTEGFNKYTSETKSAQAIVSNTGTSVEDTYAAIDRLAEYTDKTSYSFTNLADTMTQFAMAGTDLDDAETAVKGIGNWAALSGAGINEANVAMSALTKTFSSGTLSLREWDTVSRVAKMGTVNFVDELISTARETSEAFRAFEAKNGAVTFENFRETAFGNNKIITSDILLETLKKYGDETSQLGKDAFEAASEAKTFSEAIGAVKDTVSGGWSKSFRYLFGNYAEARKFWTFVQDAMLDIFTIGIDFRNEVLEKWHVADTGGWADMFDALQSLWEGIRNLGDPIGEAFKRIFNPNVDSAVEKLTGITSKFKEAAENFELLTGSYKNYGEWSKALEEFRSGMTHLEYMDFLRGKGNIGSDEAEYFESLMDEGAIITKSQRLFWDIQNTFTGIFSAVDMAKDAIRSFFGSLKEAFSGIGGVARSFLTFTSGLGSFVTNIRYATKETNFFQRIFSSLAKIANSVFKPVFKAISTILERFGTSLEILSYDEIGAIDFFEKVASGVENIATWLIDKGIVPAFELLGKAISGVVDFMKPFVKLAGDKLSEAFNNISKFFKKTDEGISPFKSSFEKAKTAVSDFWDAFKETKLSKLQESFSTVIGKIGEILGEIKEKFKNTFSKDDETDKNIEDKTTIFEKLLGVFEKIFDYISDKLLLAFDWLADKADSIKGKIEPLSGVFDTVKESIKKFFDQFKKGEDEGSISLFERVGGIISDVINAILGVLTTIIDWLKKNVSGKDIGSIIDIVLDLFKGLIMLKVATLIGNLSDIAKGISGLTDQFKQAKKATDSIKDIAISLLALAAAVKLLSGIDPEPMRASLNAISELIVDAVTAYGLMSTLAVTGVGANATLGNNIQILSPYFNFTTKIIDLAVGILILVEALKKLSKLPVDEIQKGLTGLFGIMVSLGLFAKLASGSELIRHSKSLKGFAQGISRILLTMALSFVIFGAAIKIMSSVGDPGMLWNSVGVIAVIISFMAAFTKISNGNDTTKAAGALLAMSGSIIIIAAAIALLSNLDPTSLYVTGLAVSLLMLSLGAAVRVMGDKGTLAGAAGILAVALALAVLAPIIIALGSIPFWDLVQGFGAILVAMIAFSVVGAVMKVVGPGLLMFGSALLMISGSVAILGVGLIALAAGIAALGSVVAVFGESLITAFGELLPDIVDAILGGVLYLLEQLLLAAPMFAVLGVAIITAFSQAVALQFDSLIANAIMLIISFINSLATAIDENSEALSDAVGNLLMAIVHLVAEFIKNIGNRILEFFGIEKADTGNLFTDILQIVFSGINALVRGIINFLVEIPMRILDTLFSIEATIIVFFMDLFGIQHGSLEDILQGVHDFFDNAIKWVTDKLLAIWDTITGWFKGLWNKIKGIFKGKDTETGDIAEDAKEGMERVTDAMDEGLDEDRVEDSARGVSDAVETNIDNDGQLEEAVEEKGEDVIEGFGSAFDLKSTGVTDIFDNLKGVGTGALDALDLNGMGGGLFGGAKETGSDLDDGFIKGINNGSGGVWNAATSIGQTALNALRTAIDAHSPSRITTNLGNFFGLGFAEGIDDGAEDAMHSAESMGDSAVSILKEALSGLDALDTDNIENPVIKPVLDLSEIQNGQASIADILSGRYSVGLAGSISSITGNRAASAGNQDNSTTTINMTVNGAAGQDVNDLAEIVTRRINQQLRSRERVWA